MARYEAYKALANAPALGSLVTLSYGNRVRLIEGEREIFPGLRVHWVGGHTAGLQIVSVETARGRVVLTSDASHFFRNVERYPVQIITSLPQMLAAFDTIHGLAGSEKLIVAGHDPEVAGRFTVLQPGVVRVPCRTGTHRHRRRPEDGMQRLIELSHQAVEGGICAIGHGRKIQVASFK